MYTTKDRAMGKMVSATEFKAKCLALIDEMQRTGEPLTVTRRGKAPVVLGAQRAAAEKPSIVGCLKGTFIAHDDLIEPAYPEWMDEWEAKWDARGYVAKPHGNDPA